VAHTDSVGHLCARNSRKSQPVQHATFTRDRHPCSWWESIPQSQEASGQWNRWPYSSAKCNYCPCRWPLGLRRRSATVRLGGCGFESCRSHRYQCLVFCVLSVRGVCDGPIIRPEESNRVWCV